MAGLLYYDLRNIRRTLILFSVPFLVLCFLMPRDDIAYIVTVIFLTCGYTSLPFDRKAPWFRYQLTLPVGRRALAAEKCLLVALIALVGILLGLSFTALFSSETGATDVLGVTFFFMLMICFVLPLSSALDKPGLLFLSFIGPYLIMMTAVQHYIRTVPFHLLLLVLLMGGSAALFLSYRWTCAVLEHNDF